jgi:hypothetical protein
MSATTAQIPAYGKGALPPNMHEAEGFLDEVDDVSRLIAGLHSGKVRAKPTLEPRTVHSGRP